MSCSNTCIAETREKKNFEEIFKVNLSLKELDTLILRPLHS